MIRKGRRNRKILSKSTNKERGSRKKRKKIIIIFSHSLHFLNQKGGGTLTKLGPMKNGKVTSRARGVKGNTNVT